MDIILRPKGGFSQPIDGVRGRSYILRDTGGGGGQPFSRTVTTGKGSNIEEKNRKVITQMLRHNTQNKNNK